MMLNSSNAPNPDWTNPASLGEGTNWLKAMIHPAFFRIIISHITEETTRTNIMFQEVIQTMMGLLILSLIRN